MGAGGVCGSFDGAAKADRGSDRAGGEIDRFFHDESGRGGAEYAGDGGAGHDFADDDANQSGGADEDDPHAQETLSQGWTEAFQALTDELWSLIKILPETLEDDDPRGLAFGLPMPGTPRTPGAPTEVAAQLDAAGAILVHCAPVALATRYRCRLRLVGVETDYRLGASGPVWRAPSRKAVKNHRSPEPSA